jgi:UDP-N-acetylmuramoylalanine--D-glutamate ligase
MARSGYSAAKLLKKHNNEILITDAKDQNVEQVEELKELGVNFIKTENQAELLDETFDYVIKNPGVKIDHPVCKKAKELGIPVTNEVEVAYSFLPKNVKIIGISGSNGKTTTTTLIYEILKNAKKSVVLGGNIGYPVCSLVDVVKEGDILVLEISSHQLHDIINFKTDISVLTNLSEVHIDHFGTYDYYKQQKIKIFNRHTEKDIGIMNKSNPDSMAYFNQIGSKKVLFSSTEEADACIKNDAIYYNNEEILKLKDVILKGNHNYENIMCAIIAVKEFGVGNDVILDTLKNFKGVEHRLEYVSTVNGRKFYNDSKATNVKSTQIALSAFNEPTILILGGLDRGHSFEGLRPFLKNTKKMIAFGETKNRIKEFAESAGVECDTVEKLDEAVNKAYSDSNSGDIILLSPACASWDQYKCFEDRGTEFKACVNKLV